MALFNGAVLNDSTSGIAVFPNTTASRICGVRSTNTTVVSTCCGQNDDSHVQYYYNSLYCSTERALSKFVDCLIEKGVESRDTITGANPFCQDGIVSNSTAQLTSFGTPRASPRFVYLFWILALGFMSAGHVLGAIVPSISTDLHRRQLTSCSFDMESNFTMTGNSRIVSNEFNCGQDFCFQNIPVNTGILNNNRTFNGSSAAEPHYDMFFQVLQNQTGRQFPALSSVELSLDLVVKTGTFSVGFTALSWCVNGTVANCADLVGTDDATLINACGPLFVSDYATSDSSRADEDVIQGVIAPVYN